MGVLSVVLGVVAITTPVVAGTAVVIVIGVLLLLAALLFGFAELEMERRRIRQRAGIEAAKARGVYQGRRRGTFKAKPQRARALRQRGLTLDEVAAALNVSRTTVCRYLSNGKGE
jgi:DNA invertase Pin-like site-specific DNA recombinase